MKQIPNYKNVRWYLTYKSASYCTQTPPMCIKVSSPRTCDLCSTNPTAKFFKVMFLILPICCKTGPEARFRLDIARDIHDGCIHAMHIKIKTIQQPTSREVGY